MAAVHTAAVFYLSQPHDFRNDHRLLHPLWRALSKKPVMSEQNHDVDLDKPDPWCPEVLSPSCAARQRLLTFPDTVELGYDVMKGTQSLVSL